MSSVYNTEPPTNGKVILKTTVGDIDIELWPKEAPKAVRNFVQLCLEGYYDGCSFFRLIKDLFGQTGDPTNTGRGGESIYGENFRDEYHTRLRFTHRGLLAMANTGTAHSNGSQFFITLAECEWLNNKHTIFGRITGDTMYNVMSMNDLEVENEVPVYAPKILSTQVLHSPFDDIVPREIVKKDEKKDDVKKKNKNKKLSKKNSSLLSFGEEADAEDAELSTVLASDGGKKGVVSSHDLLDDDALLKDSAEEVVNSKLRGANEAAEKEEQRQRQAKQKLKDAMAGGRDVDDDVEHALADSDEEAAEMSFDEQMRAKNKAKQAALGGAAANEQARIDELKEKMGFKSTKGSKSGPRAGSKAMRRPNNAGGDVNDAGKRKAEEAFMSPLEVMREKYKKKKDASNTSRQQDTLAKLASFKTGFGGGLGSVSMPVDDDDDSAGGMISDDDSKADADAERLRVAKTGDLEEDGDGTSWRIALASGGGLTFEKSIEEKRAEILRDDNCVVSDSLKAGGRDGAGLDMRKTQHQLRLNGDDGRKGEGKSSGRGSRDDRW